MKIGYTLDEKSLDILRTMELLSKAKEMGIYVAMDYAL